MRVSLGLAAMAALVAGEPAFGEPTDIMVRTLAADAKFIGTSMGGMRVTITDVRSGKPLAAGTTDGPTGNTDAIMQATGRSPVRTDDDAAGFLATIYIDEPTLVELIVEGPLGHPESSTTATAQRWVMPGEDITDGDGWVIEVPGIVITPRIVRSGGFLDLSPKIELMCGCPITVDGLWQAKDYSVQASLWQEGVRLDRVDLSFATEPGGFSGQMPAPQPGHYRLVFHAQNSVTGNSGVASQSLSLSEAE